MPLKVNLDIRVEHIVTKLMSAFIQSEFVFAKTTETKITIPRVNDVRKLRGTNTLNHEKLYKKLCAVNLTRPHF